MQELLFQNNLISWVSPWISSVWISVGVLCSLLAVALYERYRHSYVSPPTLHPYREVGESTSDYVTQTLRSLREYLLERKTPHHVTAHTAEEISSYIESGELRDIIHELEHIEYSGKALSSTESRVYNDRIARALNSTD